MSRLAEAIPVGLACIPAFDTLYAAYVGDLRAGDVSQFLESTEWMSRESFKDFMLRGLYRAFPQLGQSVRSWPRLAAELEKRKLLPRLRQFQLVYRREIHKSLWKVITDLEAAGWSSSQIAELLGRHGL